MDQEVAQGIFDQLAPPTSKRGGAGVYRVGIVSDPSPAMGVYRQGLAEIGRRSLGDRVDISWLRGFWDSLHVFYRTGRKREGFEFGQRMVLRARRMAAEMKPDHFMNIRMAGQGDGREGPYYLFMVVRLGPRMTGHDRAGSESEALGLT